MIDSSRLPKLPARPGCYIFRNPEGKALYVGKASSLRSRVRSYFNASGQLPWRTRVMLSQATELETVVTDSELEALILENNLIKQERPKFNIRLRDDKQYPYLCVTLKEPYPRVIKVRRVRKDGSAYFGPYTNTGALNETMSLLKKLFNYRTCDLAIPDEKERPEPVIARPCLEYFIKRCGAPCVRYVSREEYARVVEQVLLFMQGKHDEVLRQLRNEMAGAAEQMQFERAAQLRDKTAAVERVVQRQRITTIKALDQDIVALAQDETEACVQVFHVREGKVVAQDHYIVEAEGGDAAEILSSFLPQYYERSAHVPRELIVQQEVESSEVLVQFMRERRGGAVSILAPKIGERRRLVDLVAKNAREALERHKLRWMNDEQKTTAALSELRAALDLPELPNRIECYDISNIQGSSAVGSMVVFERGRAKNAEYRRFRIKTIEGANDFAMLQEVLRRRFKRVDQTEGDESFAQLPDLVIIDGGKGQLGAATDTLRDLERDDLRVVSLAKRLEELYMPGRRESVLLPRNSQALYLVQRIRDEAHRFAVTYHRNVREKRAIVSQMDTIPGVGPTRKRQLMKEFGSVKGIKAASVQELASLPGISPKLAEAVKEHLGA